MTALNRKLWRDLSRMKGQVVAIVAVLGCGLTVFIGASSTHGSLLRSKVSYYESSRFADVFSSLNRAPKSLLDRIREIPGVSAVQDRIQEAVTVQVAGFDEPISGLIVSIPESEDRQILNRLVLVGGRWPERGSRREVLVSEGFAMAHELALGQKIEAILNGRQESLTVVGIVLAPDHVIEMAPGSFFPDNQRYGIFRMPRSDMEAAFEMEGAFNELSLTLTPQAMEKEVIRRLDDLLDPYGSFGAYGREDQMSNRFVSDELKQLRVMSLVPPSIFLGVAAYLLNLSLKRLLSLQRPQIAVIKAFGYTTLEIAIHYVKLALVMVFFGIILGLIFGSWMGAAMTGMYSEFYRFPENPYHLNPVLFGVSALVALLAGAAGVLRASVQATSIPPAEAMQPEPPAVYRRSLIDHFRLRKFLSPVARMLVRELERRPGRAILSVVGIAFASSGLILGNFGRDSVDYLIDVQFGLSQRFDAAVTFHDVAPGRVVHDLEAITGVLAGEPFRSVPVRLRHGSRSKQTALQGVDPDGEIKQLLDVERRRVEIPENGLLVSIALAKSLDIEVGDRVRIEVMEKDRPHREAVVSGVIEDFEGTSAYMRLPNLNRLLREGVAVSGVYLMIDPPFEKLIYEQLRQSPRVASINLKRASMKSFLDTFGENMLRMRLFNVAFASIIAIGVIYNSMRVVLSERSRELATMRVIGFRHGEVSTILLGHLAILVLCAIPLGLLLGTIFCWSVAQSLTTDMYRIPFVITLSTYAVAAIVILVASFACALIINRGVQKLDLISVLKARE